MSVDQREFLGLVVALLQRFFRQNDCPPPPDADLFAAAGRLAALLATRGLPRPLAQGSGAARGGLSEQEVSNLTSHVVAGDTSPLLADAAKQLVKACFYPPPTVCCDSFQEVGGDGVCRRQQLERVRGRLSGSHCVDCPHWVALVPEAHVAFLERGWRGDPAGLAAHSGVFLPEDFRALRRWLQAAAGRTAVFR